MFDIIIIGGGPAGISAALYAKRANTKVLVLHTKESNVVDAQKIENYYGFPNGITGKELYENGIKQAENLGIEIKEAETVGIQNLGTHYNVKTVKGDFETKTVIIATGNKKLKPNIKGIAEFEGKGVSYCAICDAFFYKDKNVAVIGNGNFAISEAMELSYVAKNVKILTNGFEMPKTKFNVNTKSIKRIFGDSKVTGIEFADGSKINVDGIFIALGEAGAGDFAKMLGIFQNGNCIKVNQNMETNVKGIYACGNVTGGLLQVNKSVYEGAIAALSAINYVRNKN